MNIRSEIMAMSNLVVRHITNVSVERLDNTDIIGVHFDCCRPVWIDTQKNLYARSKKALSKAGEKGVQNGRYTISLSIPECKNNTRIALYKLACIADELSKNFLREEYCGLHCNHKDRTGNCRIYGYSNNRLSNLELVDSSDDEVHWHCIERLQKVVGAHFSISAENKNIINKCRTLSNNDLIAEAKRWMQSAEQDEFGTYILK